MFKQLQAYKVAAGAGHLAFSQRSLLAAGMGNVVEVTYMLTSKPVIDNIVHTAHCSIKYKISYSTA